VRGEASHGSLRASRPDSHLGAAHPEVILPLATNPRAEGVDFKTAQELLRHANARIKLDVYIRAISANKVQPCMEQTEDESLGFKVCGVIGEQFLQERAESKLSSGSITRCIPLKPPHS
jgi:hypothetical protein